jgi:hypothetical protein
VDYNQEKLLRAMIRESILAEQSGQGSSAGGDYGGRQIRPGETSYEADSAPGGVTLIGQPYDELTGIEGVGIVNSLVTPLFGLIGAGWNLIAEIGQGVLNILNGVFSALGLAGSDVSTGMSSDMSAGAGSRKYTRNTQEHVLSISDFLTLGALAGAGVVMLEDRHEQEELPSAEEFVYAASKDVRTVVEDYHNIASQATISGMNSAIVRAFSEYSNRYETIPTSDELLRRSLESLTPEERSEIDLSKESEMKSEIERYTVENVKEELKRVFVDILAELKDQAGSAGGELLARDDGSRDVFNRLFSDAYSQVTSS